MKRLLILPFVLIAFSACQSMKGLPIDSSAVSPNYDIKDSRIGKGKVKLENATLEGSINNVTVIDNSKRVNASPKISVPADAAGVFTSGETDLEPRIRNVYTPSK